MMKPIQHVLIVFLSVLLFLSCKNNIAGPDGPKGELPRSLTAAEKLLVESDQSFSYEIFKRTVAYDGEDNLFISPLSISMALAMTLNGAEGQTYDDMRETLFMNSMELDQINEAYHSLIDLLVTVDPEVTLKIANSIWYRTGLSVNDDFIQRVENHFGAEITELDFSDPAVLDRINGWVDTHTNGLIEEILDEMPDPEMVMYLINALYFKGDWLRQFDPDDTRKADFHLETGQTVKVDMMHQKGRFATYFSDEVHMIELPYGDSLFTMTVLLPGDEDMPIDRFVEEKITASNLKMWRSNLSLTSGSQGVMLYFPKFELEYEIEYNDILKAMGMDIAFSPSGADFSGIADVSPENLYINEVKHKTFIRVDEKGSEAAAVTSVGMETTSMPPSLNVNRPFVFIIHERESGTNLFMGKMKNPAM